MEHVLYADILFFINFSMDFITLYLTSRLTSGPPIGLRCAAAAAIGGIYGTASVALGIDGIPGVLAAGAVSVLMVLISFGYGGTFSLIRRSAVFWGFAALLGGVMTAICSFGGNFGAPGSPAGGTALLFAGSALCLLIMKAFNHFKRRKTVRVKITVRGRTTVFEALCDSGNLLSDPLSSRPVIIADISAVKSAVPELCEQNGRIPDSMSSKIRMIPVKGFGGDGLLTGFIPDRAALLYDGSEKDCGAVIAVAKYGPEFFGGYPANVPAALL